jgi:hypothetical protein
MHVGGIFCDLAKTFDCVTHDILLVKLHYYGIQGTAADWFRSYLTENKNRNKLVTEIFLKMGNRETWTSSGVKFRAFAFHMCI